MPDVFVSYSRKDSDFAEVLRTRLRDAGFSSWIDLEGLQVGEEWGLEIDEAIRASAALIVVVSPASRLSGYVAYEWAFALGAGVRVLPIVVGPTDVPARLASLQHLDFTDPGTRPWKSLFEGLEAAVAAKPAHAIPVARTAPNLVKEAVAALDSADLQVMENAVLRLAEMRLPEADQALSAALNHPLPDVRIAAAWQWSKRKDPRAVPGLIEGNRRRGWHLELARKLAEIGVGALPGIRAALDDGAPWMRRDLVWSLLAIGDAGAVPDLVRLLDDPDEEVRVETVVALGRLGSPDAVPALSGLLSRSDAEGSVRTKAIEALKNLGAAGARALTDFAAVAEGEELLAAIEALKDMGADAAKAVADAAPRLISELRFHLRGGNTTVRGKGYGMASRYARALSGLRTREAEAAIAAWKDHLPAV